ncbi:thiol S-methyltransferase METTL7B-like [Daphnia pulicaria]|uniref:thiol S-methyltransferase METTL7B-like n=1 Tax=Daphnia pulicaria TaxID=35523 RepID=UPI001EEABA99|nr:thiol S-methyltransferase METTL7B-like [Daphnia pulicaria]
MLFENYVEVQNYYKSQPWIALLLLGFALLFLLRQFGETYIQPLFFASVYSAMAAYHKECRELKRQHFDSMKNQQSADPELRKKGVLRILEIGPGPGYNFEFYPANSQLTVAEVNPFFQKQFFAQQSQYPHIKMERFIVGFAEDMKDVEDNSVDIVVSTMVLCSVRSIERALKEIQRVLVPGGKYYYWEHIREAEYKSVLFVQHLFSYTFYDLVFGCKLNRTSDEVIKNDKGFSQVDQQRFRTPLKGGLYAILIIHSSHVKGIATK